MSHETRTPLYGIVGMVDLIQDEGIGSAATPKHLATITASAKQLLRVLDDVLDYSRLSAGEKTAEVAPFSLKQLCEEVHAALRPLSDRKNVPITLDWPDSESGAIAGDAPKIRRALVNLVGNAIKFTEHGCIKITVRAEASEPDSAGRRRRQFYVEVIDTGIGIDDLDVTRLFEDFSQADTSNSRKHDGVGLGLAIVKESMSVMGGNCGAHANVSGPGSTFWLRFDGPNVSGEQIAEADAEADKVFDDASRMTATPEEPVVSSGADRASQTGTVLVVDDNAVNRRILAQQVKRLGHHVELACDGQEAIDKTAEHDFLLVLMDLQMPGVDGLQAATAIRLRENRLGTVQVPIIAVTANTSPGIARACADAGMQSYIVKPMRNEVLQDLIATNRSD